jgi:hypothetical protein
MSFLSFASSIAVSVLVTPIVAGGGDGTMVVFWQPQRAGDHIRRFTPSSHFVFLVVIGALAPRRHPRLLTNEFLET